MSNTYYILFTALLVVKVSGFYCNEDNTNSHILRQLVPSNPFMVMGHSNWSPCSLTHRVAVAQQCDQIGRIIVF